MSGAIPIPNLSLSGGDAMADGQAHAQGTSGGTGPFNFKGSSSANQQSWAAMLIPALALVGAAWFLSRK